MKKTILLLFVFFLGINMPIFSENFDYAANKKVTKMEKIYVDADQVFLLENGIFFINNAGAMEAASCVMRDANGLFVMAERYQCPSCKRWNYGVCENRNCPLYGM